MAFDYFYYACIPSFLFFFQISNNYESKNMWLAKQALKSGPSEGQGPYVSLVWDLEYVGTSSLSRERF